MFFGKEFDEMLAECEKWEKEDMNQVEVGVGTFGMKTLNQMFDKEAEVVDSQTENIVEGILLLITNHPKAKLLVDYDKEIVMILPKEERVFEKLKKELVSLGWENLTYKPWMWQYQTEGYVADYY